MITGSAKSSASSSASELSSSAASSGSSSSISSGPVCDWLISTLTYAADNEMAFLIENNSPDDLVITSITSVVDPSITIAPVPPFTIPGLSSTGVGAVSTGDLRGTTFTVTSEHCGSKVETFPVS